MNYESIYTKLIEFRKANPAKGYTEKHHILPRSMGGLDTEDNLVKLTGREHWIAHLLLHKIHRLPQTAHACHMMAMKCEERGIPRIKNSRMYQHIRESLIPLWKRNAKKRIGEKNGSYGTMWICNIDLKENAKIKKDEPIPEGWIAGRNKWKAIANKKQKHKKNKEKNKLRKEYAYKLFEEFLSSDSLSIREFIKHTNYPYSVENLTKLWKKYVKEYNSECGKAYKKQFIDRYANGKRRSC